MTLDNHQKRHHNLLRNCISNLNPRLEKNSQTTAMISRAPLKIQISRQDEARVKNLSAAYS